MVEQSLPLAINPAELTDMKQGRNDTAYRKLLLLALVMGMGIWGWGQTITTSTSPDLCPGGSVILTASNPPGGASFVWQESGNPISGATSQTYTATTAGVYTVLVNGTAYPNSITVTTNPNPVANFTSTPSSQCSNVPVNFSNASTGAANYTWNFGDANSGGNNTSTATSPAHTFIGTNGNSNQGFTVSLTAISNVGCTNTVTENVTTKQIPSTKLGGPSPSTYNGLSYFRQCSAASSASLNFTNQSTTTSSNTSYTIIWGDNTADYTSTSFAAPASHTYNIGTYTLQFIVSGNNGCTETSTYYVFVGSNPAVGLGNPGNSTICTGTSLTFPISSTGSNSPGTTYTVTFNDGSSPTTYTHPAPPDVSHMFAITSCNTNSGTYNNSFSATIQASNPCLTSTASVVPIYVSQKPVATFSISPKDTACINATTTFTNTGGLSNYVDNGTCSQGSSVWTISPSTGWTIMSGTLGNDFGLTDPSVWANASLSLAIKFTTLGVYTIKLKVGNPNCGLDSITKTICVNPIPIASFTTDKISGCAPLTVTATGTTNSPNCGNNTYVWSVGYIASAGCTPNTSSVTYVGGTNSSSANPQFQFNNPGTYTISLVATSPGGSCTSAATTQQIVVKSKPTVSVIGGSSTVCQNGTVSPTVTVGNCNSSTAATYVWSFPGATPSTSTSANPGSIVYNSSGPQTITLDVTNECGTTTVTKSITVTQAPDVSVPSNLTLCAGSPTGTLTFGSSVTGTTYTWTNSNTAIGLAANGSATSASPNIPSFIATNATSSPITATINVTPVNGCNGSPSSFTITVNPKPAKPTVTRPVSYCLNETAVPLTATATGSNTLNWYDNNALNNGSTTAPTPVTTSAGTFTYYVNQENSYTCKSDTSAIPVTVSPLIVNNAIASDQTLCTGTAANTLTQQGSISGGTGTYTYQWQSSTDGGTTWNNISGAVSPSYSPGNVTVTTKYRRIATSSCTDISNAITITILGSLGNYDVTAAQTICEGTAPALLDGAAPTGGTGTFTYTWESSLNNSTWTTIASATGEDYQPPVLATTTYYRRKTTSGLCAAYSPSVMVTVNPKPVIKSIPDTLFCNNTNIGSIAFSSTPNSNVTYAWTNDNINIGLAVSGTGNLPAFTTSNAASPKVPLTGNINVVPTYTNATVGCAGNPLNFKIIVLPTIAISTISNESVCSGSTIPPLTPTNDAGTFTGSTVTYSWTVSGTGTSLTAGNGSSIPSYTTNNTGAADLVTTIGVTPLYSFNGKTCSGTPTSYTVTVRPSTPSANAGPDISLCSSSTYTMQAVLAAGSTGNWTQFSGAAAGITAAASPTTQVTGLAANNTYQFIWTVTGVATCPGTTDTVTIVDYPALVNQINNAPQTICATQSITITGQVPTGGTGTYAYQWQQSADNITWADIVGQTTQNLTFTPTTSIYVRRKVVSLPCTEFSVSTLITVQPAISNNTASADQAVCINNAASAIIGSIATGGNGVVTYQWQQSTDGGITWTNIAGATLKDYNPGTIAVTTKYRRVASTNLCFGPQGNTSNVVTVSVNPDARALYTFTKDKDCAPFNINSAVIQPTIYAAQNSLYNWYANGTSIGSGTTFPGYVLTTPGDSIIIKLVAISQFGCKNDSMEHKFYSVPKPATAFTLSDTVGCGPLTVSFVNTTPNISLFTYLWDFGNTTTSTLAQPNAVTFATNPTYNDTTYTVKLNAITACETVTVSKSIRVKSKPKAVFTPNKSTGCSPMTVLFTNSSKGIGVSYIWNFGDGSASVPVTTNAAQTHTFFTGVQDTFNVKLVAINECGNDTLIYKVVVAPNQVHLDFAVNGNQSQGCKPHTVSFINASSGATTFQWNFGDGNFTNTIKNIDTVLHTYTQVGTYTVTLKASNGCSDTTSTETIQVFNSPIANFTAVPLTACIGDSIHFTNQTDTATSLLWNFRDNFTSTLVNPAHAYATAGTYNVQLKAFRQYSSGLTCLDSISKSITIVAKLPGLFTVTDTVSNCVPFTTTFTNQSLPATLTTWNFGSSGTGTGNTITHTFTQVGTYVVTMNALNPGGCTYEATKNIVVRGPTGTWQYDHGNVCNTTPVRFTVTATGTDSIKYNFGDGSFLTTSSTIIYHPYTQAGAYVPTATLYSSLSNTCTVLLQGADTIKVDFVKAGYKFIKQESCGSTNVLFTDTSRHFLNISSWQWKFGDGGTSNLQNPQHSYTATNTWTIQLVTTTVSGCTDTATYSVYVKVNNKPSNAIVASLQGCATQEVNYTAQNVSVDGIAFNNWAFSNGVTINGSPVTNTYILPGTYTATLISGTIYGCTDTAVQSITINPTPIIAAPNDQLICKGQSLQLTASSAATTITWAPINGTLSCTACTTTTATPLTTTQYIATGTNSFGCSGKDSVIITVAQPIHIVASPNDTICIGSSSQLSVTGASTYAWTPAATLSQANTAAPLATPTLTTQYQVIGFDNHNCFQDTAHVTVAVGQYPTISLGADQVLATGTKLPLISSFTNGPITNWSWSPATDLSCSTCPQPVATIKKPVCYAVTASNLYKCAARDTVCIKVFCEGSQVFIPNGFTPDGDGINDILMVRGSGIKTVKSFRIFNRWGQVVFERSNISPNDAAQGWDGKVNGVAAPPEVYVYTCEVTCDNDVSYVYKGNVAILK